MNFNDTFELYWFKYGQFDDSITNNMSNEQEFKHIAKLAFTYSYRIFNDENIYLRQKIKELELKYDLE